MKRQKYKVKRDRGRKARGLPGAEKLQSAESPQNTSSRRDFLRKIRNGALVTVALGGAGWYFVEDVRATVSEGDLSRIGNGIPSVVQIHDPQCPRCQALQREARKAVAKFNDGELQYLVANIRNAKGNSFANAQGVGHVTLLIFDAKGNRRGVLVGSNTSENLERTFRRHLLRTGF